MYTATTLIYMCWHPPSLHYALPNSLNGALHRVRDDATLRFMMMAAVFYGLSTFEGSFMAIRPVNALSHYTDWTVGHVHAGALGWVALIDRKSTRLNSSH